MFPALRQRAFLSKDGESKTKGIRGDRETGGRHYSTGCMPGAADGETVERPLRACGDRQASEEGGHEAPGHRVTKGARSRKRAGEQRWGECGVTGASEEGAGLAEAHKASRKRKEWAGASRKEDSRGSERRGEHLLSIQWK